MLTFTPGLT